MVLKLSIFISFVNDEYFKLDPDNYKDFKPKFLKKMWTIKIY